VGEAMAEDWKLMKALGPELETPAMRALEDAAARAGVRAAKACGSAAGGCLMFLAPPGDEPAVAEALRRAGGTVLRYTFDVTGVEAWTSQER
jgi:galactokinase/mevalonate kinase-like predicted kinase